MTSQIKNWKFRCSRMIIKNFGYEIMLRKLPGHIPEFNKLRLHLSYDVVFKYGGIIARISATLDGSLPLIVSYS